MEYYYVPGMARARVKIVHIIIGLDVGGAELMLKRLIESHRTGGEFEHVVISLTGLGCVGKQLLDNGIAVYSLGITSFMHAPFAFRKLRNLLLLLRPDIVQTWMYHADLFGGIVAKSIGCHNIVWNIRSTNIREGVSKATIIIRKICAILSYYIPSKIVCAAEASRIEHEKVGYAGCKMTVIPNGFDSTIVENKTFSTGSFRSKLRLNRDQLLILSVGRFNKVKDHKTFIMAADLVAELIPNAHFVMVGRDVEATNQELIEIINQVQNPEIFSLLGERDDVLDCMMASDVFCLHSKTEGFPNVLGEAMLCGLPCVSTDVGDAKRVMNNSSWIVEPSNPEQLARKLYQLLIMPKSDRIAIGQVYSERIKLEFAMESTSEKYRNLYELIFNADVV